MFDANAEAIEVPVYDGALLTAGLTVHAPSIIEEVTTTIVLRPKWSALLHESGSFVLTYDENSSPNTC